MYKFLTGCGSAVLLIPVIMLLGLLSLFTDCGRQLSLERSDTRIRKQVEAHNARFSFTPPSDGSITADQMKKWLSSRQPLLGPPSLCDMNYADEYKKARENTVKVHIEALARQSMSMNEYAWITKRIVGVLHSKQAGSNPALKTLIEDVKRQRMNVFETDESSLTTAQISALMPIVETNGEAIDKTAPVFTYDYLLLWITSHEYAQHP